jgi:hypothetical protein
MVKTFQNKMFYPGAHLWVEIHLEHKIQPVRYLLSCSKCLVMDWVEGLLGDQKQMWVSIQKSKSKNKTHCTALLVGMSNNPRLTVVRIPCSCSDL